MAEVDLKECRPPEGTGGAAEENRHEDNNTKPGIKEALIATAARAELWHTPEREPWASIGGQNWPIWSSGFRHWLIHETYRNYGYLPAESTVKNALQAISAEAAVKAPEHTAHLRTAASGNRVYLDLADKQGRAVRITNTMWTVLDAKMVPIRFHRPPKMRALPHPVKSKGDACLTELCALLNLAKKEDFRLFLTATTAAMLPQGPYPVLEHFLS